MQHASTKHASTLRLARVALLLLAGCGFSPVYGTHGSADGSPAAAQLNTVAIDNITDRLGQILRNDLIDRMYGKGRPAQPLYRLSVQAHATEEDLGILANSTSTRLLMNLYADYNLIDTNGKTVLTGKAHSVTSFNKQSDQYGTLAARQDAQQRTANEVSEQIVNRISLYFASAPMPVTAPAGALQSGSPQP